jgi:thioredoxin 1
MKRVYLSLIVVAVVIAGLLLLTGDTPSEMVETTSHSIVSNGNVSDQSTEEKMEGVELHGNFEDYSPEKIAKAGEGDVVLFFHASWCPSCRALESDIQKNLDSIPGDLSILKVNYDTESELKQKYGVRFQHTLVQVDENGEVITSWSGGNKLSDIVSRIK